MLKVRGDSMINVGILDGDFVVVRRQPQVEPGETVVAGILGEEATVKIFRRRRGKIVLVPANDRMSEMEFRPDDVEIYGKVVTVLRRL
jgi:repressor LexA